MDTDAHYGTFNNYKVRRVLQKVAKRKDKLEETVAVVREVAFH